MIATVAIAAVAGAKMANDEHIAFMAHLETLSPEDQEKAQARREKQRQERIEAARHAELVEAAKPKGMSGAMGFFLGWLIFN